jgi:anti-anti-sigma factor
MALTESSWKTDPRPKPTEREQPGRDRTVVWLRGEHDVSTTAALWDTLARAIESADTDLVVDLREVEFMGATTVSVIVRAAELLRQRSRSLIVRSPSKCARRVLDLCGLVHLIELTLSTSSTR